LGEERELHVYKVLDEGSRGGRRKKEREVLIHSYPERKKGGGAYCFSISGQTKNAFHKEVVLLSFIFKRRGRGIQVRVNKTRQNRIKTESKEKRRGRRSVLSLYP